MFDRSLPDKAVVLALGFDTFLGGRTWKDDGCEDVGSVDRGFDGVRVSLDFMLPRKPIL